MSDKQSAQAKDFSLKVEVDALLVELGVEPVNYTGGTLVAKTPITGETVARETPQCRATSSSVTRAMQVASSRVRSI